MIRFVKNLFHLCEALIFSIYYKIPGKKITVIGVTGTNGKTTTVHLIYEILKKAGKKVSIVSTIEAVIDGQSFDTGFHVTTPSAGDIQRYLAMAVKSHNEFFILEITSHALDQFRIFGTPINIGVITNISHEHLDYHGSFEKYRRAKSKILKGVKTCVLNRDDNNYSYLKNKVSSKAKIVTYSLKKPANYTQNECKIKSNLSGEYNQYNLLASFAVGKLLKIDESLIRKALFEFSGLKGRMEEIKNSKGLKIIIDFAHKPKALEAVLTHVRKLTKGKVIVIFGCAGLRDRLKRPMMGEIAGRRADLIILTAEDPRTEDVRKIINEIAIGCIKTGAREADKKMISRESYPKVKSFWRIPDRQEAINFALRKLARKGDLILIAGKGHEKSMCYGTVEYPWDEKTAIYKALYGKINASGAI